MIHSPGYKIMADFTKSTKDVNLDVPALFTVIHGKSGSKQVYAVIF